MEKVDEVVEENPVPAGDPALDTSQENVRTSRRLQIKRDNKKKKPVKIKVSFYIVVSYSNLIDRRFLICKSAFSVSFGSEVCQLI
jgi:hypothetical protein